jgi:hypothetical protein
MTIQDLYTQYLDGKVTKQKFLYEARRDQNLTMISPTNSFDDVVKILKNKSIISEKAHKEAKQSTGKQDVEIIAKTIDMVNPYEYANGMDYELGIIDIPAPDGDLDEGNVLRAQKKVLANLTKNPSYYTEKLYGRVKFDGDETVEINKGSIEAIGKGKNAKIIREGGNLGHNELSSIHPEGAYWVVTYRGPKGTTEKTFKSEEEARKFQDGLDEVFEGGFVSRGAILKALDDIGSESEIRQYLTSLEKAGDKFETVDDYVEDFRNYVADKSLEEHGDKFDKISDVNPLTQGKLKEGYTPFPMTEDQEAVIRKYAESTGIAFENLLNMVAEAKAKKKAKKDYDGDGEIESSEEEYKGSVDKAIKGAISELGRRTSVNDLFKALDDKKFSKEQINDTDFLVDEIDDIMDKMFNDVADNPKELAKRYQDKKSNISEDTDLGHQDDEPYFIKTELYQIAKQASELYKMLNALDNMGEIDFPHWWQAKIVLAKSYLAGSKDYLESALAVGNEEGEMEEAIALKDKAGNTQYAKDSTEASNIERAAKSKGVILTKTPV